jgi:hypothetical protein
MDAMKISDLLGESWESGEQSDDNVQHASQPSPQQQPPPPSVVSVPAVVVDPSTPEPVASRAPDVITSLASWAPAPEPRQAAPPDEPVSARAQLAELAAGLAIPVAAPAVVEEPVDAPDDLAGLNLVVDDLLPGATKRKGSSRGSSRSGSRRRGR